MSGKAVALFLVRWIGYSVLFLSPMIAIRLCLMCARGGW